MKKRRTKKSEPQTKSSKKQKTTAKTTTTDRTTIGNRACRSSTLTERQRIFIREYLDHYNATRAAKVAGYSESGAHVEGSRLLRNPNVAKEIERRYKAREEKLEREYGLRKDRLIHRLAQIIDSSIGDIMDYNPNAFGDEPKGLLLRDFAEIPVHIKRCIKKVSETEHGYSVQLESKQPAIETLLKVIGAFDGSSGDKGDSENRESVRRRLFELMEKN